MSDDGRARGAAGRPQARLLEEHDCFAPCRCWSSGYKCTANVNYDLKISLLTADLGKKPTICNSQNHLVYRDFRRPDANPERAGITWRYCFNSFQPSWKSPVDYK